MPATCVSKRGRYGGTFVTDPLPVPARDRPSRSARPSIEDVLGLREILELGAARAAAAAHAQRRRIADLLWTRLREAAAARTRRLPPAGLAAAPDDRRARRAFRRWCSLLADNRTRVNELLDRIPLLTAQHRALEPAARGDRDRDPDRRCGWRCRRRCASTSRARARCCAASWGLAQPARPSAASGLGLGERCRGRFRRRRPGRWSSRSGAVVGASRPGRPSAFAAPESRSTRGSAGRPWCRTRGSARAARSTPEENDEQDEYADRPDDRREDASEPPIPCPMGPYMISSPLLRRPLDDRADREGDGAPKRSIAESGASRAVRLSGRGSRRSRRIENSRCWD